MQRCQYVADVLSRELAACIFNGQFLCIVYIPIHANQIVERINYECPFFVDTFCIYKNNMQDFAGRKNEAAKMRPLVSSFLSQLSNIFQFKHNTPAIYFTGINYIKCLMWNFCLISPWNYDTILIFCLTP